MIRYSFSATEMVKMLSINRVSKGRNLRYPKVKQESSKEAER